MSICPKAACVTIWEVCQWICGAFILIYRKISANLCTRSICETIDLILAIIFCNFLRTMFCEFADIDKPVVHENKCSVLLMQWRQKQCSWNIELGNTCTIGAWSCSRYASIKKMIRINFSKAKTYYAVLFLFFGILLVWYTYRPRLFAPRMQPANGSPGCKDQQHSLGSKSAG